MFPSLSVEDNLEVGALLPRARAKRTQTMKEVFALFPRLAERRRQTAGTMSGGEQQMLAIGRCLMGLPELIMLDEPSLGLAPMVVAEMLRTIRVLNQEKRMTVLLVEQNVAASLRLAEARLRAGERAHRHAGARRGSPPRRPRPAGLPRSLRRAILWHDSVSMSDSKRPEMNGTAEPRISYAIARLHQLVFASVSEVAARHGLTALQFTTLSVLNRHGTPLSSSQLARRSFMTAQSMHEVIHRLETGRPHRTKPATLTTDASCPPA